MKRKMLILAAVLAVMAMTQALPEMTQKASAEAAWPVMREDAEKYGYRHVLGSGFLREDIAGIQFESSLANAPGNAWDVSQAQDGRVLAWVTDTESGLYDLHIAGDGGVQLPENCAYLFAGYNAPIYFNNCVSTANVTSMYYMFYEYGERQTSLDLSCFDTGSVTDMRGMFFGCENLTSLDVSGFDTGGVTSMSSMFAHCSSLTALDVSGFDTKNVTDMRCMFEECSSLTALDVSGFDTGNVTNMSTMFFSCEGLTTLDVSGFDTKNVADMNTMFGFCEALASLDVSGFNTENVTDMNGMFEFCSSLKTLDVSGFDTKNVTDMRIMFLRCQSLEHIQASPQFVIPEKADEMFNGCPAGGLTIR